MLALGRTFLRFWLKAAFHPKSSAMGGRLAEIDPGPPAMLRERTCSKEVGVDKEKKKLQFRALQAVLNVWTSTQKHACNALVLAKVNPCGKKGRRQFWTQN